MKYAWKMCIVLIIESISLLSGVSSKSRVTDRPTQITHWYEQCAHDITPEQCNQIIEKFDALSTAEARQARALLFSRFKLEELSMQAFGDVLARVREALLLHKEYITELEKVSPELQEALAFLDQLLAKKNGAYNFPTLQSILNDFERILFKADEIRHCFDRIHNHSSVQSSSPVRPEGEMIPFEKNMLENIRVSSICVMLKVLQDKLGETKVMVRTFYNPLGGIGIPGDVKVELRAAKVLIQELHQKLRDEPWLSLHRRIGELTHQYLSSEMAVVVNILDQHLQLKLIEVSPVMLYPLQLMMSAANLQRRQYAQAIEQWILLSFALHSLSKAMVEVRLVWQKHFAKQNFILDDLLWEATDEWLQKWQPYAKGFGQKNKKKFHTIYKYYCQLLGYKPVTINGMKLVSKQLNEYGEERLLPFGAIYYFCLLLSQFSEYTKIVRTHVNVGLRHALLNQLVTDLHGLYQKDLPEEDMLRQVRVIVRDHFVPAIEVVLEDVATPKPQKPPASQPMRKKKHRSKKSRRHKRNS